MHLQTAVASAVLTFISGAWAQQRAWGQCGGMGWTGSTTCVSGYVCTYSNPWYSQCLPGTAPTTSKSVAPTTMMTTTAPATSQSVGTTPTTTSMGSVTTTATSGGSVGSGPGTTLQTGYYWIRAVEAPNFHKYLQTSPEYTTGTAIMGNYTAAGQFNIVGGQLVEFVTGGLLYAVVSPQTDSTVMKLAVTFSKSKNTYGTFAFSGDAVTWTIPSINRPNNAAWLVCAAQQLFINLGPYAYNTPAGCADETICLEWHIDENTANFIIDPLL